MDKPFLLSRRLFVAGAGTAVILPPRRPRAGGRELTITKILVQAAHGRRLTPTAPNAGGKVGAARLDARNDLIRIQTAQGLEGVGTFDGRLRIFVKDENLAKLIGTDPFRLFRFGPGDRILGPAEGCEETIAALRGIDVALIDLIGKALKKPAAALLGPPVRDSIQVYDSTLYFEDVLLPRERENITYLKMATPDDPAQMVAQKAHWIVQDRPEGFKAVKIKIGRRRFFATPEEATTRDIAVTNAVRDAVGPDTKVMVDANRGYFGIPALAADYIQGVADAKIYFMEEMLPEHDFPSINELKRRMSAGKRSKFAAGETFLGGLREDVSVQRFIGRSGPTEPLLDIDQADQNENGFLFLREKAALQRTRGITMAPHNYASVIGLYAGVHIATVVPNWEFCETDDAAYPAIIGEGVEVKNGVARLTGTPGLGVKLRAELLQKPHLTF